MTDNNKNKAGTAAVLSFVFSGLGQLYNGQIAKGLAIIFFTVVNILLVILGATFIYIWLKQKIVLGLLWIGVSLFAIGLILICAMGAYSISDAYNQGKKQ